MALTTPLQLPILSTRAIQPSAFKPSGTKPLQFAPQLSVSTPTRKHYASS
jgi:hypothetical protein